MDGKMDATRRSVLRFAAIGAGAAAVGLVESSPAAALVPKRTVLRRDVFAPHVGSSFAMSRGGRSVLAVLTRIGDVAQKKGSQSAFTLVFSVRSHPGAGIYWLSRPGGPSAQLYVGPVSQHWNVYEAVINN